MVKVDAASKKVHVDPFNSNKVLCSDGCPHLLMDIDLSYSQTIRVGCLTGIASDTEASITGSLELFQCCLVNTECLCYADDFTHNCDCSDCFELNASTKNWINRPFGDDVFDSEAWTCVGIWIGTATAAITWCPGTTGRPSTSRALFGIRIWRDFISGCWDWWLNVGVYFPDDGLDTIDFGIGLSNPTTCLEFFTCGYSWGGTAGPGNIGTALAGVHTIDNINDTTTYHHEVSGTLTITEVVGQITVC